MTARFYSGYLKGANKAVVSIMRIRWYCWHCAIFWTRQGSVVVLVPYGGTRYVLK